MYRCPECENWFSEYASPDNPLGDPQDWTNKVYCPRCHVNLTDADVYCGEPCEECNEPAQYRSHLCTHHLKFPLEPKIKHHEWTAQQRYSYASDATFDIEAVLETKIDVFRLACIRTIIEKAYMTGNAHGYREACQDAFPNFDQGDRK